MDDALRSRLEQLNRGALAAAPARPVMPARSAATASRAWRAGRVPPLPGLVRRGAAATTDAGAHWLIERPVEDVWPGGEQLVARRAAALRQAAGDAAAASADPLAPFIRCLPEGAALLDLETCGLAGSALFLVGLLRWIGGRPTLELLLARDYAEEAAVLTSLWQRLADVEALATFNGKSFDWPMVADRSRRHRLPAPPPAVHVDLLHASRRRWGASLPDCRLQTLERRICGRERPDDIPGSQIPAAYEQYVRTGFEREMDAILLHNAVDLVTMLDLSLRLAGPGE